MSIKKFSRWLRAVCTILLARGRGPDRNKTLAYMHQAIDVLKDHAKVDNVTSESVSFLRIFYRGLDIYH
jgi:hypothetical protein